MYDSIETIKKYPCLYTTRVREGVQLPCFTELRSTQDTQNVPICCISCGRADLQRLILFARRRMEIAKKRAEIADGEKDQNCSQIVLKEIYQTYGVHTLCCRTMLTSWIKKTNPAQIVRHWNYK